LSQKREGRTKKSVKKSKMPSKKRERKQGRGEGLRLGHIKIGVGGEKILPIGLGEVQGLRRSNYIL